MKKFFIGLMTVAALSFGMNAVAQSPDNSLQKERKECCKDASKKCDKDKKCDKKNRHQGKDMRKGKVNPSIAALQSLNLTDAQKEQLKGVFARPDKRADIERQKIDSIRMSGRKAQLDKIKSILTHEQYVQYLENLALAKGHKQRK